MTERKPLRTWKELTSEGFLLHELSAMVQPFLEGGLDDAPVLA